MKRRVAKKIVKSVFRTACNDYKVRCEREGRRPSAMTEFHLLTLRDAFGDGHKFCGYWTARDMRASLTRIYGNTIRITGFTCAR
jgi:hypothetical protein